MKLYSKIYGDKGQDLIVIHGLFGMSDNWNTLGKKFSKYWKVHLIDLRNHGKSPHSTDFNYDVMSEDVLEYMQDNAIVLPIILGHSLGGKVAMKFAFTHPDKIEKLIVADISPREYNSDFYKNLLATLYKLPLQNFDKREDIDKCLSSTFEDKGMRLFLLKNLYRNENKAFAWRFNIEILLEKVSNIQEADFITGVSVVPTHFIKGGSSNHITTEDERIINKHFSDFSIATIDGAGHWLHAENPEKFYSEVMGFCLM
ncbi:MAG: alpha/beta fold hydrolase [Flavobacteriales bacterium]|jgi:esterase|nr:alpha/beta fold hydrolase [Flavobacteriales bacterium]MBT5089643.1 alpha/beta fold hydrolase [Flavobacteriales bacterium]MBT5749964.1 alpha/beta fold hydrolase [Flavobacteriales bacterium]